MQLTEHFSLSEFTRSSTASRLGIDNTIPEVLIPNLRNLCEQVLEPLREFYGAPIHIASGYRCLQLNKVVGGVENSQHMTGEAADVRIPLTDKSGAILTVEGRKKTLMYWAEWIMDNCCFDQLIIERAQSASWLHISCKLDKSKNRQQVLVIKK